MFGHRADGRRLSDIDPIIQITPYLMPMRCDAQVFLQHNLDYEKMSRYIVEKSKQGEKITFMQIIVAAYVRGVSQHPEVNRFIFNKQYYSRKNCSVSYAVLKDPQNPDSVETTVKINFDPSDTIFDVRDRMNHAVETSRATEDGDFVIKLAKFVLNIPGEPVHGDGRRAEGGGGGRRQDADAPHHAAGDHRGRAGLLRSALFGVLRRRDALHRQSGGTGNPAGNGEVRSES